MVVYLETSILKKLCSPYRILNSMPPLYSLVYEVKHCLNAKLYSRCSKLQHSIDLLFHSPVRSCFNRQSHHPDFCLFIFPLLLFEIVVRFLVSSLPGFSEERILLNLTKKNCFPDFFLKVLHVLKVRKVIHSFKGFFYKPLLVIQIHSGESSTLYNNFDLVYIMANVIELL